MRRIWVLVCVSVCVAVLATTAGASTVDFETFTPVDTQLTSLSSGGLDFTSIGGLNNLMYVFTGNPNDNTNALISAFGEGVAITAGGSPFTLNSFDMTISWYDPLLADPVGLTAFFQGGGSSTQTLNLIQGLQTYNLNLSNVVEADLSNVASNSGYWALDNITYNASTVPEPGTLPLLGCGALACLGVLRRKLML